MAMTQTEQHLLVQTERGVRTLTLNRPARLNALTPALAKDIQAEVI